MRTWLLVADGVRGRIFKVDSKAKKLVEIREFLNPEGRFHERELRSDAPGKTFDREGLGRHVIEEGDKKKEQSKEQFAHKLAIYLNEKHQEEKINRLVVVAPSKILGYITYEINKLNCSYDVKKIAKEITSLSPIEIFNFIENDLFVNKVI